MSIRDYLLKGTTESITPLGGNAKANDSGATGSHDTWVSNIDRTGMGKYSLFRVFAFADQAGTINIQQSADNTTWYTTDTAPVVASTPKTLEGKLYLRYVRANYVNGAQAQGTFLLASALVKE